MQTQTEYWEARRAGIIEPPPEIIEKLLKVNGHFTKR